MAVTYENWKVIIEDCGTSTGPETKHPIDVNVITPGGTYTGYGAQLLLEFLQDGELPDIWCGEDYVKELYILYALAVGQLNKAEDENKKLKEELQLTIDDYNKYMEYVEQLVKEKRELKIQLHEANEKLQYSAEWNELANENRKLRQKNTSHEAQIRLLNEICEDHKHTIKHLQKEKRELMSENKHLLSEIKALKTRDDLNMTVDLAAIFAEFTDKDRENRAYLDEKIEEFKKKYSFE